MNGREQTEVERIFNMEYSTDQVDEMVDEIIDSADLLAKVLFAGFNIVFLVVLGIILISNLSVN